MRRIILLLLLIAPLFAKTQVTVVKKPTVLIDIKSGMWNSRLEKQIIKDDTSYIFIFRNKKYDQLVDMKTIMLTKVELKDFSNGLKTSFDGQKDDRVMVGKCGIIKEKTMGFTIFSLYYDNGYCEFSPKQIVKLMDIINKE